MPDSLPFAAAEKALALAEQKGVARQQLLAAAQVPEGAGSVSFRSLCAIYEDAARLSGDDAFGLHVGEWTSAPMYGQLGYVIANSLTFGDALAALSEFQPIWTQAAGLEVRRRRGSVGLRYWHRGAIAPGLRRQESEQMLAALLAFARRALGAPVRPRQVRFEHRAPANLEEHKRIFGAPIVFGADATEIVLPEAWLALTLAHADPILGQLMREQAQTVLADQVRREPLLDALHQALRQAIFASSEIRLADLAAAVGVEPRTLQRRLRQQGLTFRQVADEARVDVAKRLLEAADLALGQIAFRLGYSQTSAFHRAFRRIAGTTPGDFRRNAIRVGAAGRAPSAPDPAEPRLPPRA